jgi:Phage tail baseplate hub (GPD)
MTRLATVTAPAGDSLLLRGMIGEEELGRPFMYELELLSLDANIDETSLLGEGATVTLELPDESKRYFHGIIADFSFSGMRGRCWVYHCMLRPWLWLLGNHSDTAASTERKWASYRLRAGESGWDLLSYVAFQHGYVERLIELGYQDTPAQRPAIEAFFA